MKSRHTMAANTSADQGSIPPIARSQTPEPIIYRSPAPRRLFSSSRISRRRATSLQFTDLNRKAILDEAFRREHQTPPLDQIPSLEEPFPAHSTPLQEILEAAATVPSLSSSASSTPSASAFGLFPTSEPLSLSSSADLTVPTTIPACTFISTPPVYSFDPIEYIMPSQYGYTPYSTASYPSGYLSSLPEENKNHLSREPLENPPSYPGSYAPTPALDGSPALPTRAQSAETESGAESYSYTSGYPFPPVISAPPSSYGYPAPQAPLPGLGGLGSYVSEHNPNTYGVSYSQAHPGYLPTHGGHYHHTGTVNPSVTQAESMRVVDPPKESRCWDHGCNGRTFSTHSNLLRHIREKSGQATKSTCPRCGAVFTRKTAMNGHMAHDKCKRKSGYSSSSDRSGSGLNER